mmetsp:Transcript_8199/g.9095  ORF Transcript_8199/g.9095 Transcript_8199/m.9095 type:complete len:425 (+) Transcript_8199:17-1291(+)
MSLPSHRVKLVCNHFAAPNESIRNNTSASSLNPRDVVIVSCVRTPMGSFQGGLAPLTAVDLGATVIKEALKRGNVSPTDVDEVYFGNVLQANQGQNPARQATIKAGIPNSVPATTVNKVCASGMKAATIGAAQIRLGLADVIVAGGMESMSNAPYYLPKARKGMRLGHGEVVDAVMKDGLSDAYGGYAMGICAEMCSEKHNISRPEQDDFALSSYNRAEQAWKAGAFDKEVVAVEVPQRRKAPKVVKQDEDFSKVNKQRFRQLRGVFGRGKTVTAGNASTISDGAAALVLMSAESARRLNCKPLAVFRGWADAAQEPDAFTTAPALAIPKAIKNASLRASDIDFYEINEAFSVVAVANMRLLKLNPAKVNIYGGGVSIGHPIGCSGARIIVTLLTALQNNNARYGCAGICNGGGGASACVIERL